MSSCDYNHMTSLAQFSIYIIYYISKHIMWSCHSIHMISLALISIYVTFLRDAGWIGGLTKVMIYPTCANQLQKIAVLATLIQALSGSRVVSYPVTHKQLKQTNSGYSR